MKNLIGNDWRDSSNLNVTEVYNPATKNLIDTVPSSTIDDVVLAVNNAKINQPGWDNVSVMERCEILTKFIRILKEENEFVAKVLSEESGKTLNESLLEIDSLCEMTQLLIGEARRLYGKSVRKNDESVDSLLVTIREPLGVVGVILPKLFTMDTLAFKVISAILMGNAVIIKPSRRVPLTVTRIAYMLRQAGVHESIVQVVHGEGKVVGQALAMHPDVNVIAFNGSTANGIRVIGTASKNLNKTLLNLSGNNAFVVCRDANIDLAVDEAIVGRFYNAGQLNTSNKRFIVQKSLKEVFINKLVDRIKKINVGLPNSKKTDMGCLISEQAAQKVEKQVDDMINTGAKLVIGGRRKGSFYEPTIVSDVLPTMPVASNLDILGPVISIIEFDKLNEAVDIINQSAYALGTSIFTNDLKVAIKMASLIESGKVIINSSTINKAKELNVDGWKYSSFGREGVTASLEEMSREKIIVLDNILG